MSVLQEYIVYKQTLLDATQGVLETAVADLMKKNVHESVVENVYAAYEPTEYERRGDNYGLSDINCYRTTTEQDLTGVILRLENLAYGNARYASWGRRPSQGWDPGKITNLIETGKGYHWTGSKIYRSMPYPRPFMEAALEKTMTEAEPVLVSALKRAGF